MRDKATRKAIVYEWSQTTKRGYWKSTEPVTAWTVYQDLQDFTSSLSVPVYATLGAPKKAGVLTFSSQKLFLRDDFIIAECAAHLITQALFVTARMIEPAAMGATNKSKLKELEVENQRLKIIVANYVLEKGKFQ